MIPQHVTQKEYDAIPDTHVHLTDEIDVIHKHPRMGIAALDVKIKAGWNICLKDGSPADAKEVKRVRAFIKKVVDTEAKREEKRLADVAKQTDKTKFTRADLDTANEERDEAIGKLEDVQAEIDTLRADLTEAESDLERDPEAAGALKAAQSEVADLKAKLDAANVTY